MSGTNGRDPESSTLPELETLDSPAAVPDAALGRCSRQDSTSRIPGLVPPASMQSRFRGNDGHWACHAYK